MYMIHSLDTHAANPVPLWMLDISPYPIHESAKRFGMEEDSGEDGPVMCSKCYDMLPLADFRKKPDGSRYKHCKACHSVMKANRNNRAATLEAHDTKILAAITRGVVQTLAISEAVNHPRDSTYNRLLSMEKRGMVTKTGTGKAFRWVAL